MFPLIFKKTNPLTLLFAMFCLTLTSVETQSAQLIDELPSSINKNWSICATYQNTQPECVERTLQKLPPVFNRPASQFVYQKTLVISSELNQSILGLWLNVVDETDEVRLNGFLIGKTGKAPPNYQSGFRYQRLYLMPYYAIKYNQFNQLEIKTYSSINRPGLRYHSVFIGDYLKILEAKKRSNALYVAIITILILLTAFQIFYYFLVKGNDETIYLTLFLIAFTLVTFTSSPAPLHIGLDLNAVIKMELFLVSIGFVAFNYFVLAFFQLAVKRSVILGTVVISLVGIISIIYPNPLHLRFIYESGYWLICLVSLLTLGYTLLRNRSPAVKFNHYVLGVSFLGWLLICFDALTQSKIFFDRHFEMLPWLLPMVAALIGFSMVIAVTHKYWLFFKTANYDHLTGMLLKPIFFSRLNEKLDMATSNNSTLLIAVVNIIDLSNISSDYGQKVGYNILQFISQTIYRCTSSMDLVCQFNSQEFCLAIHVDSRSAAEIFLKHLHKNLVSTQQPLNDDMQLYMGAKIGAVIYDSNQHPSVTQLLQDANYGLERAKNQPHQDVVLVNDPTSI